MNTKEQVIQTVVIQNADSYPITIRAIAGAEGAENSSTYWKGRQASKTAPRKDLVLSNALPRILADDILASPELFAGIAEIVNDAHEAYVRRVKCQRLEVAGTNNITLFYPVRRNKSTQFIVAMLTEEMKRGREKKLVSTSSLREMKLSSDYKIAAAAFMGARLENWKRIFEVEFLPLVTCADAAIRAERESVRDKVCANMLSIAALMQENSQHKVVLEAAAEILADVSVQEFGHSDDI